MFLRPAAAVILLASACRHSDAPKAPGIIERLCTSRSQCTLATFHTRRAPVASWARPRAEAWLRTLTPVVLEPERDVKICRRFQCSYVRENEAPTPSRGVVTAQADAL